jgi:hypothetical protein
MAGAGSAAVLGGLVVGGYAAADAAVQAEQSQQQLQRMFQVN